MKLIAKVKAWFGLDEPKPSIRLAKGRGYTFEIVGEAAYQLALMRICGGKTEAGHNLMIDALLFPEVGNKFDPNAVAVRVRGQVVGYIPRVQASAAKQRLADIGALSTGAVCSAKIVGGWDRDDDDSGNFGVKLNLAWPLRQIAN